jgi:hypothetical protein
MLNTTEHKPNWIASSLLHPLQYYMRRSWIFQMMKLYPQLRQQVQQAIESSAGR